MDWESDDPPRRLAEGTSPAWRPARITATPAILDVYPLAVGTTWVYSVTLDEDVIGHWTGRVTETVTAVEQQGEGLTFRCHEHLEQTGRRFTAGGPDDLHGGRQGDLGDSPG
jgi:hypothetical protein